MVAPPLATPQDVLDSRDTAQRFVVYVNGVPTDALAFEAQFGVDQDIATARLELPLPRPAHVVPGATVVVQGGWNDLVGPLFAGRIPARAAAFTERGATLTLRCVGWASLLAEADRFDLEFDGPISLRDLFLALCARAKVPAYAADETTTPAGVEIALGASGWVNGGKVVIPSTTTPLAFLRNAAEPFGFKVFDTPTGVLRLMRVSGMPVGAPVARFVEGEHLEGVTRAHDIGTIVNWWDVRGETLEKATGQIVPVRSIAASVPAHPDIPGGRRYKPYRSNILETKALADAVRQRLEIDFSAPSSPVTWDAIGLPGLAPGDVVRVEAPTVETGGDFWLTDLDLTCGDDGLSGAYTGWAGAGVALPNGRDRQSFPLETGPLHLGNDYLNWYQQPNPAGTSRSWTVTIPARATAVNILFRVHGANDRLLGDERPSGVEPSRFELWRPGAAKPESTHPLPELPEVERDYRVLRNWTNAAVALRGTEAGRLRITLVAGTTDDAGGVDDLEVRDVVLEVWGAAEPRLPKERA